MPGESSLLPQYYNDDFQVVVFNNAIAAPHDPTILLYCFHLKLRLTLVAQRQRVRQWQPSILTRLISQLVILLCSLPMALLVRLLQEL